MEACLQKAVGIFNSKSRDDGAALISELSDEEEKQLCKEESFWFKVGDSSYCAENSDHSLPCTSPNACKNLLKCCTSSLCGLGE